MLVVSLMLLVAGTVHGVAATVVGRAPTDATTTGPSATLPNAPGVPASSPAGKAQAATNAPTEPGADYVIGPGDQLQVFVWREPDLTVAVPVRPDGRVSIPLVEDIECTGKTATELAREIENRLKKFVNDPVVTVIVQGIGGASSQQVRVVGEAAQPRSLPYTAHMTALDAMIDVGGLTAYAAGNRATIVRKVNGKETSIRVHLGDLLKDGDMSANVDLQPGDIIIIPQTFF